MGVHNGLAAPLGVDKLGDIVHGTGPVEGVQRGKLGNAGGLGVLEDLLHALGFKLEHPETLSLAQHPVSGVCFRRAAFGNGFDGKTRVFPAPKTDEFFRAFDNVQGLEPQKVHFNQAPGLDHVHGVLARHHLVLMVLIKGHIVGEVRFPNHHPGGMDAGVAVLSLQLPGQGEQFLIPGVLFQFPQPGLQFKGPLQGHLGIFGDELGDHVRLVQADVQRPRHILYRGLGLEGAEGDDLPHPVLAVFFSDVPDNLRPAFVGKVHVKVGHGNPLGVEEALKEQVVLEGIDVGDPQGVGHNGPRAGSAAGPHGDAVFLGPVDKIRHNEEVAGKAHFDDHPQLILRPLRNFRGPAGVPFRQALHGEMPQVPVRVGKTLGNIEVWKQGAGLGDLGFAALGNADRVGDSFGVVGEERRHFVPGFKVELLPFKFELALGVVPLVLGADTEEQILGHRVLPFQVVYIVGGHQGDSGPPGNFGNNRDYPFLGFDPVILNLQIEVVLPKEIVEPQSGFLRLLDAPRQD